MKIALALPHTPWIPERVSSFKRLQNALDGEERVEGLELVGRLVLEEREPLWAWTDRMFRWGLESEADYLVQIQDDVTVAPAFWHRLHAMLQEVGNQLVALHTCHPAARMIARDGAGRRWCTTADGFVGVAWAFPRAKLAAFLEWKDHALKPRAVERVTEDMLVNAWCLANHIDVWHPIPTIIRHDEKVPSTYGNDAHRWRMTSPTWEDLDVMGIVRDEGETDHLSRPEFWRDQPIHLGRFFAASPHVLRSVVRDPVDPHILKLANDDLCPEPYARRWAFG